MQAKGTLLIDYVKIIRENKDKGWDKWLKPEDWEIINSNVLPSTWYPYESMQRIGFAVFKEIADSNLDLACEFGKFAIRNLFDIYKNLVIPGDPVGSVKKLTQIRANLIKGDAELELTGSGDDWLNFKLVVPPSERGTEHILAFVHQMSGSLIGIVENTGEKNVSYEIKTEEFGYTVSIRWQ